MNVTLYIVITDMWFLRIRITFIRPNSFVGNFKTFYGPFIVGFSSCPRTDFLPNWIYLLYKSNGSRQLVPKSILQNCTLKWLTNNTGSSFSASVDKHNSPPIYLSFYTYFLPLARILSSGSKYRKIKQRKFVVSKIKQVQKFNAVSVTCFFCCKHAREWIFGSVLLKNFRHEGNCNAFVAFFTVLYGHLHKWTEKNNEKEKSILSPPIFDTGNSHREVRTLTPWPNMFGAWRIKNCKLGG